MANSFIENINTIANATAAVSGDILEDAREAANASEVSATQAKVSEDNSSISEGKAQEWAEKGHNNPVIGVVGEDAKYSSYHWATVAGLFIGDPIVNDGVVSQNYTWSSQKVNDSLALKSSITHLHTGVYEPIFTKSSAFNKNFGGTGSSVQVSRVDHTHTNTYEPKRATYGTAFNKDFGTASGTVMEGDTRFDSDYMPLVPIKTAYNKAFVADSTNPQAEEIPRGTHGHNSTGIIYDNTGSSIITSSTVQGALTQLESYSASISVSEKCNVSAGMTNDSQVVTIDTAEVGVKLVTAMTTSAHSSNAIYSGGDIVIDYDTPPEKLIAGWINATVTIQVEANKEYIMALWANDTIINEEFVAQLGDVDKAVDGAFTMTLDSYLAQMENGTKLSVGLYNMTDDTDITVYSHAISFAGEPEGSLVISGSTVDHSDITGTGAANGVHTISDIQNLQTALDGKTETASFTENNLVTADSVGNMSDSGITVNIVTNKIDKIETPTLDNLISMDTNGNSKDSGYKIIDLALLNGSTTELFNVSDGTIDKEAVNFSQLDSVNTTAKSKITKVSSPTEGNFPQLNVDGELVNSSYDETSFAEASHTHSIGDVTNLQDTLDEKYIKITAVTDNVPIFGAGDTIVDSGVTFTSIELTGESI